ncbi:MAG: NAD-dependent DNA ligase LigA [Planctomycetia bacterium]|nr:NAD-dependent DNA ligase LigA [Planctomycetia bacterium]
MNGEQLSLFGEEFFPEETEARELREKILRYNRMYYESGSGSEISDLEYDMLVKRLETLEREYPELKTPDSPTQRVGGETIDSLPEVFHRVTMLSIKNEYEPGGVLKFASDVAKELPGERVDWVMELKIDGVAISLIYQNGLLTQGVTRGNGKKGNDVTHNVRTIPDIPLRLVQTDPRYPIPPELEIRGEVYMTNDGLARLNEIQREQGKELYANPRNAASGSILLKDPKICAKRPLRMFCHSVGDTETLPCRTHSEFLEAVASWGLIPTPDVRHYTDVRQAVKFCEENLESLFNYDFEADGFVLKVDDFEQRKRIGETPKFPKWLVALKFQKYEAVTKLLDIFVQVGKTGVITPVADLQPVELAGTTVSRSSLHNADEIHRKDIRVGDWVVVEKAGKIIPHIVRSEIHRRETELPEYVFPTTCSSCGTTLRQDEGGVYIRCPNLACPARWSEKLLYFGSRDAMEIKGLGDKLGQQLIDNGFVKSYADLYRLRSRKEEIVAQLHRVGNQLLENLFDAVDASKSRGLSRLLNALSIPHLGAETAELLALKFQTLKRLQNATLDDLSSVDGIGDIIAQSVYAFLQSPEGKTILDDLQSVGVKTDYVDEFGKLQVTETAPLAGQTVVVTGKLTRFTRDEIETQIKRLGGKTSSSVSQKTSFVVAGADAGSKLAHAQKRGIPVLSEEEFLERIRQPSDAKMEGAIKLPCEFGQDG